MTKIKGTRIEQLHKHLFIHRDLKPENIAVGLNKRSSTLYLFDFGLSRQYADYRTLKHIQYSENKKFTGTVRYASLRTHFGVEQSRRDDLESMGYILVYLAKGNLPWQGLDGITFKDIFHSITKIMASTSISSLCNELPSKFNCNNR